MKPARCHWCGAEQTKKRPLNVYGHLNVLLCVPCQDRTTVEQMLFRITGDFSAINLPTFVTADGSQKYTATGARDTGRVGTSNRKYKVTPNINQRGHRKKRKELIKSKRAAIGEKNVRIKDRTLH